MKCIMGVKGHLVGITTSRGLHVEIIVLIGGTSG